tara:strand:- start:24 stop:209 length:186 start_codon:yes stop_codon:yes gene_type:complete
MLNFLNILKIIQHRLKIVKIYEKIGDIVAKIPQFVFSLKISNKLGKNTLSFDIRAMFIINN